MNVQNLYQVVKDNFKKSGKKTYIHLYFYIGKHKYPKHHRFGEYMRKVIDIGWNEYQDEHLTGFLIYYSDVYIHILEGSDYAFQRHIEILSKTSFYQNKMSDLRFLHTYYHIRHRMFKGWDAILCEPPKLSEKMITDSEDAILHLAFNVLKKVYDLAKYIASGGITEELRSVVKRTSIMESEVIIKYTEMLPEQEVIVFLTECDLLNDVNEILEQEKRIYQTQDEIETVWPLPELDIPYHLLTKSKPPPFEDTRKSKKKDDEPEYNEREEKEQEKLNKQLIDNLKQLKEKTEKERQARLRKKEISERFGPEEEITTKGEEQEQETEKQHE